MWLFAIAVLIILAAWPFSKWLNTKSKKINIKLAYCIICSVVLVLLAGLRGAYVGFGDDKMYMNNFQYVQNTDVTGVYEYFNKLDTETPFYLMMKIVTIFTDNYNVFLIICAIPVVLAISVMIYKHSKMPVLSYLIFSCAFFYLWSLVILRQAVAMSFIILAIEFLTNKKYWKFALAVVVATLFHRTAAIFILALPLSFVPYSKKGLIVFMVTSAVFLIFGGTLMTWALGLFENAQHYSAYITRDASFGNWRQILKFLVYISLTFATVIISKNDFKKENSIYLQLCLFGCLLCALAPSFAEMFRLGLYFTVPLVVILPNAIMSVEDRKKRLVYVGVLSVALVVLGVVTFQSMGYQAIF